MLPLKLQRHAVRLSLALSGAGAPDKLEAGIGVSVIEINEEIASESLICHQSFFAMTFYFVIASGAKQS